MTLAVLAGVAVLSGLGTPSGVMARTAACTSTPMASAVADSPPASGADAATWRRAGARALTQSVETGDPAYYSVAERALARAKKLARTAEDRWADVLADANLALARHDFVRAGRLAQQAHMQRPDSAAALVALIDADVELGRYEQAIANSETLLDLKPGTAALARHSYLQQLRGDLAGAVLSMRQAVSAAADGSAAQAQTLAYLGDVLMERGDLAGAGRAYGRALAARPGLATAVIGSARVGAAMGDAPSAIRELVCLTERVPVPGALILLADLQRMSGDERAALETDDVVRATVSLFEANGADVDVELAVFEADRGNAAKALQLASRVHKRRQTLFTADAMAWALLASGRAADARVHAERVASANPGVALLRYHAAEVFRATDDREAARREISAAARSPFFSISHGPKARALASALGVAWPSMTIAREAR